VCVSVFDVVCCVCIFVQKQAEKEESKRVVSCTHCTCNGCVHAYRVGLVTNRDGESSCKCRVHVRRGDASLTQRQLLLEQQTAAEQLEAAVAVARAQAEVRDSVCGVIQCGVYAASCGCRHCC
jgi:hypothetical protein